MNAPRTNYADIDTSTLFTRMVDEDIQKCDTLLNNTRYNRQDYALLHTELTAKYASFLADIGSDMYYYNPSYKFFNISKMTDFALQHNLRILMNKLIAFKNYGYRKAEMTSGDNGININNTLSATQTQLVHISFDEARQQIEDMTGLSDTETEEALQKIDELKAIAESKESKKKKWQKVKPFLLWLADKSVDVGITILPLLMNIGS